MITGLVALVFSAVYVLIATERINRTVHRFAREALGMPVRA